MINLNPFRKSAQGAVSSKYPDIVYEIHKEFNTASDRILEEANKILAACNLNDVEKCDRLVSIGFRKVKQVVDVSDAKRKAEQSKDIAELVKYYSFAYPFNKFITEIEVEKICKKYGLVCGKTEDFTGFVPDKNLREIEAFKIKEIDQPFGLVIDRQDRIIGSLSKEDIIDDWCVRQLNKEDGYFYLVGTSGDVSKQFSPKASLYSHLDYVKAVPAKNKLMICAPVKDFDMIGKSVKGYHIVKDDPIVLKPVNGGYLIVTAWGDEASDPIVVNNKMN